MDSAFQATVMTALMMLFCSVTATPVTSFSRCPDNSGLQDGDREDILLYYSTLRQRLSEGKISGLPKAKGMHSVEWDCKLERQAEAAVKGCPSAVSADQSHAHWFNFQPKQMSPPLTAYILDAEKYMPSNPAGGFYQENQTIRFNGKAEYRPFANAIRSKATRIGCSIDACLNDDIVGSYNISGICFFEEKEIEKGDKVYKVGDPCVKNSDCDENEVCTSYSLCYKSKLARKASHMHNELRSDLAMGKVENKNSKKFPKASFMFRLTYSDFLERTAYEQAELWDNSESGPLTSYRNQSDSNNYFWANRALVTQSYATDKEEALKWAINHWWDARKFVDDSDMDKLFIMDYFKNPVATFAEMARGNHYQMGCAVAEWNRKFNVVCAYAKRNRRPIKGFYDRGEPCAKCSATCDRAKGLC
uniref:Venom allergen/ancylostoma secreted protein-like 6 n=1 Tax=Heligmosomoides polygyrus bakeri TaxID=375939 RepID=G4XWX3_HELBE|nr:venom allergen/ancylostoma secreted protein-like 6 [Heligmosomoides bakeri]